MLLLIVNDRNYGEIAMKMMQMWSNMTQHRLILTVAGVILLALLAVIPQFNSVYLTVLISTILAFVIQTVAWTVCSGPTGYVSIASSAFFGIGMYTAAIWGKDLPFTLIILIAAVISALFAIIIGAVTLRLRGIYFTIFTFGLVFLIQQLLTWWEITFTHTRGRFVVSVDNDVIYYHMLIIFLVLFVTTFFLRRSKWGTALKSIGQNEDAATQPASM
jgi:branched-chain amino acid transport system permease protein